MPDIIDGYCAEPHITPDDARIFHASIVGEKACRLSVGGQCKVSLADANTLSIADGEIVVGGTRVRIPQAEEVKIANGVSGMKRNDLLLLRYERDPETNVEETTWRVAQGISSTETPEDPDYTEASILSGAVVAEYPIARVSIDGILPGDPEIIAPVYCPFPINSVWQSTAEDDPNLIWPGTTWEKMEGRFLLGSSEAHELGLTGGEETHLLTLAEMPSHNHTVNNHTHTTPAHTHNLAAGGLILGFGVTAASKANEVYANGFSMSANSSWCNLNKGRTRIDTSGAGTSGGATPGTTAAGSSAAHNNMPPYEVVNMWKRVA